MVAGNRAIDLPNHAPACPEDLERGQFGAFPAAGSLSVVRNDGLTFLLLARAGCVRHVQYVVDGPSFMELWTSSDEQFAGTNQVGMVGGRNALELRPTSSSCHSGGSALCRPAYRFHFFRLAAKGAYDRQLLLRQGMLQMDAKSELSLKTALRGQIVRLTSPGRVPSSIEHAQTHDQARGSYAMAAVKRQQPAP